MSSIFDLLAWFILRHSVKGCRVPVSISLVVEARQVRYNVRQTGRMEVGMNRGVVFAVLALGIVFLSCVPAAKADDCGPSGKLQFVCGPKHAEDMILVPGTHWIIASGLMPPGHIHLIDADAKTWQTLYPGPSASDRMDAATYADCPGPPDPQQFSPHGLNIRSRSTGLATLYAVNHGGRQAIEVFSLDARSGQPVLTWIGCAVMPKGTNPNAVAPLPGGGFVVTSFVDEGKTTAQMFAGVHTGAVYEWHPNTGFHLMPGTELAGDNGVEISRDGKQMYVAATGGKSITRFPLQGGSAKSRTTALDFEPDNVRWRPDGKLLIAGRADTPACGDATGGRNGKVDPGCAHGLEVVALDPRTMKVQLILREEPDEAFTNIATALQVNGNLWFASVQFEKVAYLPVK
jgi:hypothetical protein